MYQEMAGNSSFTEWQSPWRCSSWSWYAACRRHLPSSRPARGLLPGSSLLFVVSITKIWLCRSVNPRSGGTGGEEAPGRGNPREVWETKSAVVSANPASTLCYFPPRFQKNFYCSVLLDRWRYSRRAATTLRDHSFYCWTFLIREHNRGIRQGSEVLCVMKKRTVRLVSLLSERVRRRLALSAIAPRLTRSDYRIAILVAQWDLLCAWHPHEA